MALLLGIDLGTSSVRAVVIDETGSIRSLGAREYPIDSPRQGWAEQSPKRWFSCTCEAIGEAMGRGIDPKDIQALSFAAQMHGGVLVAADGTVIRPAIIWADQRSTQECEEITARVGLKRLAEVAGNRVSPGFMAATLAWLKKHEPDALDRANWMLLPKDYICLRLTGRAVSEPSDASATLLFDINSREWSDELVDAAGISKKLLPPIIASSEIAGGLTTEAAAATGLIEGTPVVIGGADQCGAAVGNGVLDPGTAFCAIGTGGQFVTPTGKPAIDPRLRTNCFCHVMEDRWYAMGATLSAGLSLRWLRDQVAGGKMTYNALAQAAAKTPAGAEGLFFLPYLVGERTPHIDPYARGCFVGLTLRHGIGHMARAVMEGVAWTMRDAQATFAELGVKIDRITAAGGGGASPIWRQILADVLNRPLWLVEGEERAGVGAALIAGVGVGVFPSLQAAAAGAVRLAGVSQPSGSAAYYEKAYPIFRELYQQLRGSFEKIAQL